LTDASRPAAAKDLIALRGATVFAVNLGSFLTPFMGASLSLGLPAMGRELQMDAATLSWVASALPLAAAVFTAPMGRIADIYGRRRVPLYGNLVFTLFSLVSAFAPSAAVMIVFRALQGMGGAMVFATGMAILTSVFPPGERGRVTGDTVTAVYLGLALGPFAGGFLTQHFLLRRAAHEDRPRGRGSVAARLRLHFLLVAQCQRHHELTRTPAPGHRIRILGTLRLLGQNASMGIVMIALHGLDAHAITDDLQASFVACLRAIFWVFSGMGVLGIFASLARGRGPQQRRRRENLNQ
jgi:MFS family permease